MIRPIFGRAPPFSNGRPFPKGDVERTVLFLSCVPICSPPAGILTPHALQETGNLSYGPFLQDSVAIVCFPGTLDQG